MIRIISGQHKGRRIAAPKKLPVRPTTDMAKESLFNILGNRFYFKEIRVLDLYSGTGNISYEFASRGTTAITAVDGHYACVQFIQKTAQAFDFTINTIKSDVLKFLKHSPGTYDFIFADPPYDLAVSEFMKIIQLVFEHQLLTPDGLLVIEHAKHTKLDPHECLEDSRHYGSSAFSFYSWAEAE